MSVKVAWRKLMNRHYIKISRNNDEYLWIDRDEAIQLIHDLQALLLTSPVHRPDNDTDSH